MTFEFYIPQKLHGLVDRIWEHKTDQAVSWTVLPSAKIELLFRIGPAPELIGAKKIEAEENPMRFFAFMSGLQTAPLSMNLDSMHFIGVQMAPVAFKAFFGIPLSEIRDYYLPGSELLETLDHIEDKLNGEGSFTRKAQWLEDHLFSRIIESPELHLALSLSRVCDKFFRDSGMEPHRSIEELLGYSRTHTFRLFQEWFGLSPHHYLRLQQFVHVVHDIHTSHGPLTMIGLANGYYDQAHFIRTFKSFAGLTPGQYRKLMTHIPGQIPG